MRMSGSVRIGVGLGMLVGALAAATYSWTFTRLGRLDYRAAVLAKVASFRGADPELSASARADANAFTSDDLTCYYLNITNVDLPKVIDIESEGLLWPEVPGTHFGRAAEEMEKP